MKNMAMVLKATAANIVSSPSTCLSTRVVGVGHPPQFHLARRLMEPKATDATAKPQIMASSSSSYGDPCLDIFFNLQPPSPSPIAAHSSHTYTALINSLKQKLPVAWSHNPFTTLKLIYDLSTNHLYLEALSMATSWLHRNHPSTLARNLDYFDGLYTLVDILSFHKISRRRRWMRWRGNTAKDTTVIRITSNGEAKNSEGEGSLKW